MAKTEQTYTVIIKPQAERDLKKIKDRDVLRRISTALSALARHPRPHGVKTLEDGSAPPVLRIRVGDYRILYTVQDDVLTVTVVRVGKRSEIYQRR